jgi:regulator of sigma E protease
LSFFANSDFSALPQVAVVLGIMVLVHEFGHFAAAKLCGVRVESFAIGFGKRLLGFVHDGTDYRLNLIPLGGYVKMAGEYGLVEDAGNPQTHHTPTLDPGEYQNHPRWQRVIIALAGPIANFVLAFLLLTGLYMTTNDVPAFITQPVVADYVIPGSPIAKTGMQPGDRIVHFDNEDNPTFEDIEQRTSPDSNQEVPFSYLHNGTRVDTKLFVENKSGTQELDFTDLGIRPVEQNVPIQVTHLEDASSPAARAGLKPGDDIVAIDGLHLHSVPSLLAYMQQQGGKPAVLTVSRPMADGTAQMLTLPVTPALMDIPDAKAKAYRLGFTNLAPPTTSRPLPLDEAVEKSTTDNIKNSKLILVILKRLFTRQVSVKALSSPIGIGVEVHEALKIHSWTPIIEVMAMISLNLGIFNLLPIPILDGGTILFLAVESALRRDLNYDVKERVYQVAFVCIVLFAAMVIFNDLTRFVVPHIKL